MSGADDRVLDIVRAVAVVEGVEPHELEFSLHTHVDTDAIQSLTTGDTENWELTFEVPDHVVTIDGSGAIRVDGDTVRQSDGIRADETA